jgi:hypothetical protein
MTSNPEVMPIIQCTIDLNGRSGGQRTLLRVYTKGASVTLSAPPKYPDAQDLPDSVKLSFAGWQDQNGKILETGTVYKLESLSSDMLCSPYIINRRCTLSRCYYT